jgi:VanZ family protein
MIFHKPQWINNRYFLIAAIFYVVMFILASMHFLESSLIWTFNDKLLHFLAYFFLTIMVYLGLRSSPIGEFLLPRILWCFVLVSGAGALDELAQYLVDRDSSFDDWLSNTAAVIVVLLLIVLGTSVLKVVRPSHTSEDIDG